MANIIQQGVSVARGKKTPGGGGGGSGPPQKCEF